MDYRKLYSRVSKRRKTNLLSSLAKVYMSHPNSITLAHGMPNAAVYPVENISITYKNQDVPVKLEGRELSTVLQYGSPQGYLPLLEKWKEFQKFWHAPRRDDWDIVFTCGSLDGCNKIFDMMLDENDAVIIQTPTYPGILGALASFAPDVIEINQDADGIIPEEIARECEKRITDGRPMPKLLYVNPTAANPTGATLSETRRKQVYELAQKYNFLIVEDDPYYFLHFLDKQPTSFFSLDTDGRVIRLDSFSKIVSAGIRVGVVTARKDIVDKLIIHMENSIIHPASLSQTLLAKLFEVWNLDMFKAHFKDVQRFYRKRRDIMLTMIEKHLTGLAEWYVPQGGLFFWLTITAIDNIMDLVNKCIPQGVFIIPGNAFYYDPVKLDRHLRLSYSYSSPEEMDKGLSRVAEIIREEVAKKNTTI